MESKEKEFLELINRHQNIIHKVCSMYTDNKTDYEDLFQEALMQLWQGYSRFKGESKVTTWMYRVVLYTAISGFKRKKKQHPEYISHIADHKDQDTDRLDDLHRAIGTLTTTDKALVMLYLEEKSYREIAEIMGITESNVGVKLNRIKKKLKEMLTVQ